MISEGAETSQLANPPVAPAAQIVLNLTFDKFVTSVMLWSSCFNVLLYVMNSKELRAPYPRIGAAEPVVCQGSYPMMCSFKYNTVPLKNDRLALGLAST